MKYEDGQSVLLGDKVDLGGGLTGMVVAVIDASEFSGRYLASEWEYLLFGALVESEECGLIHYPDFAHVTLVERSRGGSP